MAKLYFRYGTMGSSKTANVLMTKFNYEEKGYNVLLMKPSIDNRDGENIIKSRIGLQSKAHSFNKYQSILQLFKIFLYSDKTSNIDCIIVDEVQFCTKLQIEELKRITEIYDIPVFTYGLRTDFKSNLFEGSKRLFEIADSISEIKSVCNCGNKAIINARIDNNHNVIYGGEQIHVGGNDKYVGMCYKCWKNKSTN